MKFFRLRLYQNKKIFDHYVSQIKKIENNILARFKILFIYVLNLLHKNAQSGVAINM